jgi:hypothetical protein
MTRVYKSYKLNIVLEDGTKLNDYKYSGRPGDLNSKDDFYILSNRMVVLETSLMIYDKDLYKNLTPSSVPKWLRCNVANMLAQNGKDWISIFFTYNSGTHNNQWLIVDMNKFEDYIHSGTAQGIVYLVEQIPTEKSYYTDMSAELIEKSYVSSHNAPYFEEVINLAGYKSHNQPDYFNANRYKIFKELNENMEIRTVYDVMKVMRYHDSKEMCDTIAPRCDIGGTVPFGAVDSKITDFKSIGEMKAYIIQGPPAIKGISENFDWGKFKQWSHEGMPEVYDFKWILI